jgi:hypothetical protein
MESALKGPRGASPCLSEYMDRYLLTLRQNLLQQVQCDESVETLLETIRDVFEFAEEADNLRNINPGSKQATILEEMLECVSECARFIKSYAEDVQVGMLSWLLSLVVPESLFIYMNYRKADFKECGRPG